MLNQTESNTESMVEPFFKDEYAIVELDASIPCIQLTLRGIPRYSEHYNFVQSKRLELMHEQIGNFPRLHMLTDSRTAGPVLDEDVTHFKTRVMPAMENAGIRYLAIVLPNNKFTQLTIKEMTKDVAIMTVRYFDSIEEARQWLQQMSHV